MSDAKRETSSSPPGVLRERARKGRGDVWRTGRRAACKACRATPGSRRGCRTNGARRASVSHEQDELNCWRTAASSAKKAVRPPASSAATHAKRSPSARNGRTALTKRRASTPLMKRACGLRTIACIACTRRRLTSPECERHQDETRQRAEGNAEAGWVRCGSQLPGRRAGCWPGTSTSHADLRRRRARGRRRWKVLLATGSPLVLVARRRCPQSSATFLGSRDLGQSGNEAHAGWQSPASLSSRRRLLSLHLRLLSSSPTLPRPQSASFLA
ncbi:hypothetical protein BJY59DRAFT_537945 [Rhodotorula toruloides]